MNRELLEKPFAPEEIKQRQGNFGKTLDYIEAYAVIKRLNDAFDAHWSFRIRAHKVFQDIGEVLVLGELTAGDIIKTQFGSSKITKAKETGEIISLADDLKSAATDALKKTATLLGVGLQLYNGKNTKTTNHPPRRQGNCDVAFEPVEGTENVYRPQFTASRGEETEPPPADNRNGNGRRQLSMKQFGYIRSLGRQNYGYSLSDLSERTTKIFGVEVHALSTSEASRFIEMLQSGEIRSASM